MIERFCLWVSSFREDNSRTHGPSLDRNHLLHEWDKADKRQTRNFQRKDRHFQPHFAMKVLEGSVGWERGGAVEMD